MDVVGRQKTWSFRDGSAQPVALKNPEIRRGKGHLVRDYMDLARKVAHLQFLNRDYIFLFRGQSRDHLSVQGSSLLKPKMFRNLGKGNKKRPDLRQRYADLRNAEQELVEAFETRNLSGKDELKRQRIVRWSILQHYEVCPTPLLDVTHSLRIATSFASDGADSEAFLFVLAVPNLSGAITASAESSVQIVRLSSVCPKSAVRPHIQEGYLLGEYPELTDYRQQQHYKIFETDFGRRLIAKFRFNPKIFWGRDDNFPQVNKAALYPNSRDSLYKLTQSIKRKLEREC